MKASLVARTLAALLLLAGSQAAPAIAQPQHTPRLEIQNVSSFVDYATVLPGQRFPLRVLDAKGRPIRAAWRAEAGKLVSGELVSIWQAPLQPGVHRVTGTAVLNGRRISRTLNVIVTVPAARAQNGHLNGYPIGHYPRGFGAVGTLVANRGSRDFYTVPAGFIELTPANLHTKVSAHYELGDFAGKDGWVAGHKYMFLQPRMIEKLERVIGVINAEGYPCGKLKIMSGYRSPELNASIGNVTTLSRHTYGDAADVLPTDFNGDGRIDARDARILYDAANKLDHDTDLTGGEGFYHPTSGHGYFVHIDARGKVARW